MRSRTWTVDKEVRINQDERQGLRRRRTAEQDAGDSGYQNAFRGARGTWHPQWGLEKRPRDICSPGDWSASSRAGCGEGGGGGGERGARGAGLRLPGHALPSGHVAQLSENPQLPPPSSARSASHRPGLAGLSGVSSFRMGPAAGSPPSPQTRAQGSSFLIGIDRHSLLCAGGI